MKIPLVRDFFLFIHRVSDCRPAFLFVLYHSDSIFDLIGDAFQLRLQLGEASHHIIVRVGADVLRVCACLCEDLFPALLRFLNDHFF